MKLKFQFREWLRVARAQTAPATMLLILVPYLTNASLFSLEALIIGTFALLAHWISFGHNTLMDFALGYDKRDPSKQHFPLHRGALSLHAAHNVIHWGLSLLTVWAIILSFWLSPNPAASISFLLLWVVFGQAYNDGLSKESLLGFIPISVCFTAAALWGWFLSHRDIDTIGLLYSGYVFFTILFQISWSGFIKEIGLKERSNILVKMGAHLEEKLFKPGKAWIYAWIIKGINLYFGILLLLQSFTLERLVTVVLFSIFIIIMLHRLTKSRIYRREKELMSMSIMEILTIYLPLPLLLDLCVAGILMIIGLLYFFLVNLWLWRVPHPAV